jgi:hypothetical protein
MNEGNFETVILLVQSPSARLVYSLFKVPSQRKSYLQMQLIKLEIARTTYCP